MTTSGRTRPFRAQTRQRLLDAASSVFAERGIATCSINDIAAAAGLTKGAFYSSFASKDELVLTLMEQHVAERLASATDAFEHAADVSEGVLGIGAALTAAIHADPDWQHLLFEYCCLARRDDVLHDALQVRRREARLAVTALITRVAAEGSFPLPMPADELAIAVLALSNGLALEDGIDPDAVPDDLLPRLIARILR